MAATEAEGRRRSYASVQGTSSDETKNALKTTEFVAMVGVIAAILIATWVSDTLNDVRGWTLVAAVAIGYMLSRGLAKSGSRYRGGEDALNRASLVGGPRRAAHPPISRGRPYSWAAWRRSRRSSKHRRR